MGLSLLASGIIIKKSRLEYLFSITLTWIMCVHLSTFRRTVPLLFFQFSLLFFIKIKNFFWIRVSCHLLNDISKICNFYRIPLIGSGYVEYRPGSLTLIFSFAGSMYQPQPNLFFIWSFLKCLALLPSPNHLDKEDERICFLCNRVYM